MISVARVSVCVASCQLVVAEPPEPAVDVARAGSRLLGRGGGDTQLLHLTGFPRADGHHTQASEF